MAGLGSRFSEAGYRDPKPMVDVDGKPMIAAVIDSIGIDGQYIFVVQQEHLIKYNLDVLLNDLSPGCRIVSIDGTTDGAARTTLFAKYIINNNSPLVIANSDQIVDWDGTEFVNLIKKNHTIALFNDDQDKWSYAKIKDGLVTEVAEKKVISNNATVGIYGWKTGADYVKYAEQMIDKGIKTNNEFYIAPVYNEALQNKDIVVPYFVNEMHGIGTPEDLENYLAKNRSQR
jgi:NDP-sugar pyrophosphorylase family protein